MLESVCVDEKLGALTMPEDPLVKERAGHNRIFRLAGGSWLLPATGQFRPSAIECLGDGRVLILERDFGRLLGRAVALRPLRLPAMAAPNRSRRVKRWR